MDTKGVIENKWEVLVRVNNVLKDSKGSVKSP